MGDMGKTAAVGVGVLLCTLGVYLAVELHPVVLCGLPLVLHDSLRSYFVDYKKEMREQIDAIETNLRRLEQKPFTQTGGSLSDLCQRLGAKMRGLAAYDSQKKWAFRFDHDTQLVGKLYARDYKESLSALQNRMCIEGYTPANLIETLCWATENLAFVKECAVTAPAEEPVTMQKGRFYFSQEPGIFCIGDGTEMYVAYGDPAPFVRYLAIRTVTD